ncbi:hypothetical protein Tco_1303228 [Tanacetum coccineum]
MQAQEQEELSIEEKATLFQQLLEKRRKHFAAKRAEEKRKKPPTKAQQRKIMCTYLKNMEGYKLKDLKFKEFDSIQEMFDRAFKRVNTFEDFRTELVEGKEKRAGTQLIQEITKKQKVEDNKETTKLKQLMKIIPDEEELALYAIPFAVKEDLEDLYKLVKAKYESTRPVEDLDLILWGDLKTMFEPHVEDKIYMLVEKKYPLAPLTLSMMLEKKLMIDYESEMAYQLLKFIMKQVKNSHTTIVIIPNIKAAPFEALYGRKCQSPVCLAEVLAKLGTVAYRLELPQQLSRVHSIFHVSNLKKCLSDEPLAIPLDEIHIDDKLYFNEEPVEIMDREVKRLKQSCIPIIKVRRNSRRGPEFTWECEDQFRKKYPHLFTKTAPSTSAKS